MDDHRRPLPPPRAGRPIVEVAAARLAVFVVFIGSGFGFASWASRIPQVRDQLHASPSVLGLILLALAAGSLIALPLSGILVTRIGAARSVALMAGLVALGLVVVGVGSHVGIWAVVLGLFMMGFGNGTWDVAMNVEGAAVEQRLGYSIMSRFHAGFSLGTVLGALGGAGAVVVGLSVTVHLIVVAALLAVSIPAFALRGFLRAAAPSPRSEDDGGTAAAPRHPLQAWTEPRTLLIGVFVLCMAFTEGTGNDWLAVAMIDGYHTSAVVGPLTFAVFLAAMTAGRWFGPRLLDRYGRVPAVRTSALIALVGLLLVVFGQLMPLALLGATLLGLGAALGFPVGMSAAADDPARSAARVSVVASIGYTAFLAGPPLIGFLGDHVGVLHALTVTAALLGLAAVIAGSTRPLGTG